MREYVTKEEFCKICGISKRTAYLAITSGQITYEKCCQGLLHYYRIPIEEIAKFKKKRKSRGVLTASQKEKVLDIYRCKLFTYPELLYSEDVQEITGYSKEAVRRWIKSGKLNAIAINRRFCIAKSDLLRFLISKRYENIQQKSEMHLAVRYAAGISDEIEFQRKDVNE